MCKNYHGENLDNWIFTLNIEILTGRHTLGDIRIRWKGDVQLKCEISPKSFVKKSISNCDFAILFCVTTIATFKLFFL